MAPLAETEWTLMFYFASDTPLASEIVSQLKNIKQAGFHPDANVIAQFDPHAENAETHIFDVNRINKIQAESNGMSKIGFIGFTPNDPFVVNLMTDKLWRDDKKEGPIREEVIKSLRKSCSQKRGYVASVSSKDLDPPVPPLPFTSKRRHAEASGQERKMPTDTFETSRELSPRASLTSFLKFCSDNYPARHYILFILGHGLVVGNDTFLFDEHAPEHFLQLQTLREVLEVFKKDITRQNSKAQLELVSFHSCSMSSAEVAFELQGLANYMLASQGPSFVGSWPYRQILIRIFNYLERKETNVKGLLKNIFHYCLYNSYDFLVAGYSCDGCLCDLNKVKKLTEPVSQLSDGLVKGLNSNDPQTQKLVRERILLAHLDAQSYFVENYTDLFDFCFRLKQRIEFEAEKQLPEEVQAISTACESVMKMLKKGVEGADDGIIVRSEFVGPAYQYSHGLSVYFPWLRPLETELERMFWPKKYQEYKFFRTLKEAKKTAWSDFLAAYFESTRRHTRAAEFAQSKAPGFENEAKSAGSAGLQSDLLEAFATAVFNQDGELQKPDPDNSNGPGCDCQSIKNYPPFTREASVGGLAHGKDGNVMVSPTLVDDKPTFQPDASQPTVILDGLIQ